MRLNIRNMVCRNCVRTLEQLLQEQGLAVTSVGLGYAEIEAESLTGAQQTMLDEGLQNLGFERITDRSTRIAEEVKQVILEHINSPEPCHNTLSHCIEKALGQDYKAVSRLFSAVEGRTIEKYYVSAKVEKAKELLSYGDVPLAEIAYRLGYSSTAFLSRQFKQETGMTPTEYQRSCHERRAMIEI